MMKSLMILIVMILVQPSFAREDMFDRFDKMIEKQRDLMKNFFSDDTGDFRGFSKSLGAADDDRVAFDLEQTETDKNKVLKIIPKDKKNFPKVDIADGRILIQGKIEEKEETQREGFTSYSSSVRTYSRILPVPQGVDEKAVDIKSEGEALVIRFPKRSQI